MLARHLGALAPGPVIQADKEFEDILRSNEPNYGSTSLRSASAMGRFALESLKEQLQELENRPAPTTAILKLKAQISMLENKWTPLIRNLGATNVIFAYSGYGTKSEGHFFTSLILIDLKAHCLYEVYLTQSSRI